MCVLCRKQELATLALMEETINAHGNKKPSDPNEQMARQP